MRALLHYLSQMQPPRNMTLNRRNLLVGAGALALSADAARAAPLTSTLGRDATQSGVRPNSPDDQTDRKSVV